MGHEIRLGTLVFIADDSAWLQEGPLDVESLPVRGAAHFRASACGVLRSPPLAAASDLAARGSSGG